MQEECRRWDVNELVFSPAVWPSYHSLMRADFTLFDSYTFEHQGEGLHITEVAQSLPQRCSDYIVLTCSAHVRACMRTCRLCLNLSFHHGYRIAALRTQASIPTMTTRPSAIPYCCILWAHDSSCGHMRCKCCNGICWHLPASQVCSYSKLLSTFMPYC